MTLVGLCIIVLIIAIRPRHFTFYCGRHHGTFTSRRAYPPRCTVCEP